MFRINSLFLKRRRGSYVREEFVAMRTPLYAFIVYNINNVARLRLPRNVILMHKLLQFLLVVS